MNYSVIHITMVQQVLQVKISLISLKEGKNSGYLVFVCIFMCEYVWV